MSLYFIEWMTGDSDTPNRSFVVEMTNEQAKDVEARMNEYEEEWDGEGMWDPVVTNVDEIVIDYESFVRDYFADTIGVDPNELLKGAA